MLVLAVKLLEQSQAVREKLNNDQEVYDPRKIIGAGQTAIKQAIKEKIELLNSTKTNNNI